MVIKSLGLIIVLSILAIVCANRKKDYPIVNPSPIIGIFTLPVEGEFPNTGVYVGKKGYIATDYVYFLKQAGARVVALKHFDSNETNAALLNKLNGVLFTGGAASTHNDTTGEFTALGKKGAFIINNAVSRNQNGTYFPVWSTCLGYELVSMVIANDPNLLGWDYGTGYSSPIKFTTDPKKTRLYNNWSDVLLEEVTRENITYEHHSRCVYEDAFYSHPSLANFFNILSTSTDQENNTYISSIEGKEYPFYGTQYHPEKNQFSWIDTHPIPHSPAAVKLSQNLAWFFVNECRKNNQTFDSQDDLDNHLVDNQEAFYQPTYTGEVYLFA